MRKWFFKILFLLIFVPLFIFSCWDDKSEQEENADKWVVKEDTRTIEEKENEAKERERALEEERARNVPPPDSLERIWSDWVLCPWWPGCDD